MCASNPEDFGYFNFSDVARGAIILHPSGKIIVPLGK